MDLKPGGAPHANPDPVEQLQRAYARWLEIGARLGLGLLIVTFVVYVFDIWEPHVPIEHLPYLWSLPAQDFRIHTEGPGRWEWLGLLGRGDFLTYLGVAVLSLVSMACFLRIFPVLAASGIVSGGH